MVLSELYGIETYLTGSLEAISPEVLSELYGIETFLQFRLICFPFGFVLSELYGIETINGYVYI